MRVLHVISSLDPRAGGTTTALAGLAEAQRTAGIDVAVVATCSADFQSQVADALRRKSIDVELVGPTRGPLKSHPDIDPTLQRLIADADLVHVHAVWEQIQHRAARLAHAAGKPYIMTPHGMLDPWCLNQSKFKKKLYLALRLRKDLQRAAALYCTTQTERDLIDPLKLTPPTIIETLGLDLSEFESLPERGSFRADYPQLGDKPMVLFLSRIHHKKGLDLLIPAFAQVERSDAMLVIAGPDSHDGYRATVETMVREHGLDDRVIFTGMLYGRARIAAMVDADLFALPSYQENFGIVVIESMAAGTPLIVSDQVNIHHDVTEGRVGTVIPTQVEPLAGELNRWLKNESLREAAAARCRPFAWERYDWRKIGQRWVKHYDDLLKGALR